MPCPDGKLGRGGLVAAHGRGGVFPGPGTPLRGLRQHPRVALRHHGAAAREPGNGKPLLQGFPAVHDPRHRPCTPPVGRRARHRPHRHARRKFGRGIPGHRMGGLGAGAHRQTDPDRHGGQGLAPDWLPHAPWGCSRTGVRWDTTSRSRTGRNSPQYTAHRPTSNIRARNSAGATTPTRTMPYSTPSTPTTRGAGAAG